MSLDGYNPKVQDIIKDEFPHLLDNVYLDHAGATLYAKSQLCDFHKGLLSHLYGNPHSHSQSSRLTSDSIAQIRYRILSHFNTTSSEYSVIFTAGCTGALKIVADCFDFSDDSNKVEQNGSNVESKSGCFCYVIDNHTSVQGIREVAASKGAMTVCIDDNELEQDLSESSVLTQSKNCHGGNSLFAYPAMSNFSGQKYPLDWISRIQAGSFRFQRSLPKRWFTVLDAAALVGTSPLDLGEVKPDFVTISFYKMFGFPTGLGALLILNQSAHVLKKTYYGGGTVAVNTPKESFHVLRQNLSEKFEDGTVPYLDILALQQGFDAIETIGGGVKVISRHTFSLARYFHHELAKLRHSNGTALVEIYCASDFEDISIQGGIVCFNLKRSDGSYIGCSEFDKLAQSNGIHLRTGCFCNMGACQRHLRMITEQIRSNYEAGHLCSDEVDLIKGRPTGAVRVSFGYMSTLEDARKCLQLIEDSYLLAGDEDLEYYDTPDEIGQLTLRSLFLYPVKSCGPFEVSRWRVGDRGLLYDRHWMVVNDMGVCLTQKRENKLCLIQPRLNLVNETLTLHYPGMKHPTLEIPLKTDMGAHEIAWSTVCEDRILGVDCGQKAADWLSDALQRPGCRLIEQYESDDRQSSLTDSTTDDENGAQRLSLANVSQYLLISKDTVKELQKKILRRQQEKPAKNGHDCGIEIDNLMGQFRANLVVEGGAAFEEEKWQSIIIGGVKFQNQALCRRCSMVAVDQKTGMKRRAEPLGTLSSLRGRWIQFGILLQSQTANSGADVWLSVGDLLTVTEKQES